METIRLILFVILAFLLLQIWQTWQKDTQPESVQQDQQHDFPEPAQMAEISGEEVRRVLGEPPGISPQNQASELIRVETDTLVLEIDSRGAVPRIAWLKNYPVSQEDPDELTVMFDDSLNRQFYVQAGAVANPQNALVPNHTTLYTFEPGDYSLQNNQKQLEIVAVAALASGMEIERRLIFTRGSYQVKMVTTLFNNSGQSWQGRFYNQLVRAPGSGAKRSFFAPASYEGAAYYTAEQKYTKISYEEMGEEQLALQTSDGWVAMLEHYFVAALVPEHPERFYTKALDENRYAVGSLGGTQTVAPGTSVFDTVVLYVGPKEQYRLEKVSPGLELTTDFGMLTFLAQPVFWVLKWLHGLFGNWGWAIIGVTVILKALFYPLSAVGYRSMAKMKGVQPKMVALREAYADDKTVLNQKMMELYRTEKINPLGGCLPILIQIPVFIALYWVLLESVELRQASFVLWITDLSQSDPYYVLPVIMGASMLIQQRLNPAQLDPLQQKVMMAMPVVFTFFFLTFPAGLVLYWVVNNILSILQQWHITRKFATS